MDPNAIAKITDYDLISTLDLDIPQYAMNEIFLKHGMQGIAYLMVRSLGFETPVKNDTYGHFEKDESHDNLKVHANVGDPGAGNDIVFVLDADSLDTDNNYYVREFDVIMFNNEVTGWVTDITVTAGGLGGGVDSVAVTVRPNLETDNIDALTADEEVIITSGAFSEGSGMPNEVSTGTEKYTNDAQIIKEAIGATGTALVTETYIAQWNKAKEFQGFYSPAYFDLDYRMLTKIDGMFWWGKRTDTTGSRAKDAATNRNIKTSEGLVPAIRRKGNTNTYTAGAFSVTKFDTYDRILTREYVPSNVPVWCPWGLYLYQEMENTLKTYFNDTNISYVQNEVNDKLFKKNASLGASVNFKYLQKSNRTYMFTKNDGWSNPKTYGTTGYDMERMGVIIPIWKRKDPKSKNDIPSIGVRYRSMGAYNRRMITSTLSGIGASYGGRQPVNTIDKTNTYQFAHMGNEFFGLNQFILVDNS